MPDCLPVSIVIGDDSLAEVQRYAQKYTETIYEDASGDFYHSVGVRGVLFLSFPMLREKSLTL